MRRRCGQYRLNEIGSITIDYPEITDRSSDVHFGSNKASLNRSLVERPDGNLCYLWNDAFEESPPSLSSNHPIISPTNSPTNKFFTSPRFHHQSHLSVRNGGTRPESRPESIGRPQWYYSARNPLKLIPIQKIRIRSVRKCMKPPPVQVLSFLDLSGDTATVTVNSNRRNNFLQKISNPILRNQSDAFVNSQEWTMSRGVNELKLGLVGSLHSGKTSLVHRYLTGAYTNEESPEGGRFKKEVVLDGQSYLLLIRDEGNSAPDYQFAQWVDAVIFVFSLESQESVQIALHYYEQMSKFRNINDIPVLLIGSQDAVNESNPRVISEQEGRQMAKNLPKCSGYYETCSTYGLNVERIFKDG